jgi:HPt (histidine-containing phosphotransfer) domain-containing protein
MKPTMQCIARHRRKQLLMIRIQAGPDPRKGAAMIDWTRLTALRHDIGEADFSTLAHLFVAEMGERLAELSAEPQRAKAEDFHFLRGSAANLGFVSMVTACHDAEAACRAGDTPDIAAVIGAFDGAMAAFAPVFPGLARALRPAA